MCGGSSVPDAGVPPAIRNGPALIIGGDDARPNEFPFQVCLLVYFHSCTCHVRQELDCDVTCAGVIGDVIAVYGRLRSFDHQ